MSPCSPPSKLESWRKQPAACGHPPLKYSLRRAVGQTLRGRAGCCRCVQSKLPSLWTGKRIVNAVRPMSRSRATAASAVVKVPQGSSLSRTSFSSESSPSSVVVKKTRKLERNGETDRFASFSLYGLCVTPNSILLRGMRQGRRQCEV